MMDTTLQGSRITLRPLQYTDADALVRAAADGESRSWLDTFLGNTPTG